MQLSEHNVQSVYAIKTNTTRNLIIDEISFLSMILQMGTSIKPGQVCRLILITGMPGVGKSTTVKRVFDMLRER